jgi:hypothetical protein
MPLSEGDQGYSVAENKPRGPAPGVGRQNSPSQYTKAGNVSVDPQFSELGDIKPVHGNKGGAPTQPTVGYHRAGS